MISCDTYYYMLANDLGITSIHEFTKQFGFGQLTGVDIPGELSGLLPSIEWKKDALIKAGFWRHYFSWNRSGIQSGHSATTDVCNHADRQ